MNKLKTVDKSRKVFFLADILIVFTVILLNLTVTRLVIQKLQGQPSIVLIDGFLQLTYYENNGAIFGILPNQILMFLFISLIFELFLVYIIIKMPADSKFRIAHIMVSVLLGGSVCNCIDRIRYDCTIEYVYFIGINFPIFNLPDFLIFISTVALVIILFFRIKEKDLDFLTFKQKKYRELK